jgi:ATP-dependent RNA helicase RhlE
MSFTELNLSPILLKGLAEAGFSEPTPIQAETIPPALAGKDILGLSQTGSGKTAAFVLPILQRLERPTQRAPRAVIIAPTRELVVQIGEQIRLLGAHTSLRFCALYGGVSPQRQISVLQRGVDIIVGCPGRILDLIQQGVLDMSSIKTLVLDEADTLFDMGFLPSIRKILSRLPKVRQNLLFSATMPEDIEHLAQQIMSNPVAVRFQVSRPKDSISQSLHLVGQTEKHTLLCNLLKENQQVSTIVFTRTKHRAKRLARSLSESGFRTTSLQGNLSQNKREEAMEGFRSGKYQVLVATDIASRGIDVAKVGQVVNFDAPSTIDSYTHRIGRTGRAERQGISHTFLTPDDEKLRKQIVRMFPELLRDIEKKTISSQKRDRTQKERPQRRGGNEQLPPTKFRRKTGSQSSESRKEKPLRHLRSPL